MSQIIMHRINSTIELSSIESSFGVEVDVRSFNDELICAHNPFKGGELFEDWLNSYRHSFLIINIKEEGIEEEVIRIMDERNLSNYFLLDVTFPFFHRLTLDNISHKIAYRVSDYEQPCKDFIINNKIKWIWLDAFMEFPEEALRIIQKIQNIKICIVSPELHMQRDKKINASILTKIKDLDVKYDLICTKNPEIWL